MKQILAITIAMLSEASLATAQDAAASPSPSASPTGSPGTATAESVVVTSQELDISREQIVPSLGATRYTVGPDRLNQQAQGEDAPFNQTILRFPGVAQDSFGQLHLRGEHANLQYRINDVLLPEGITGFGQELSTRFADNISLITGALPAQFGFRTTGVIDVHTKTGADFTGGEASIQVGSFDTILPSFEYGGVTGKLTYYVIGSYLHNGIGIENPTRSSDPIHDDTDQFKGFDYFSYIIDDSSRFVLMLSGNYSNFQIPNNCEDNQDGKSIQPAHQHCLHTLDRDDFPRRLRPLFYSAASGECRPKYDREVYRHNQRIRHHARLAGKSGARPLLRCGRDTEGRRRFAAWHRWILQTRPECSG